jgi:hypothetical protein
MQAKAAKDFIVGEILRQANDEGVHLSDLERRLLYFTEESDYPDDPSVLDEGFESEKEGKEYEAKISGLARRAYRRVKKENSADLQLWNEAIRELKRDDHYLLVLLRMKKPEGAFSIRSFLITLALGIAIVAFILVIIIAADRYGIDLPDLSSGRNGIPKPGWHTQSPKWIQHIFIALLVAGYIYAVAAPTKINEFLSNKIAGLFRRH